MNDLWLLPEEVIQPASYTEPLVHMGPFVTSELEVQHAWLKEGASLDALPFSKWLDGDVSPILTQNGREAIHFALKDLALNPDDEVWIITTSKGPYVSGCITQEISRFCRWSMEKTSKTKAIFMVHDFGFPCELPPEAKALGVPIIEDCAYGIGYFAEDSKVGRIGDYLILSFVKAFPMQYGGLVGFRNRKPKQVYKTKMSLKSENALKVLLNNYWPTLSLASELRKNNYQKMDQAFKEMGLTPRYEVAKGVIPSAYLLAQKDFTQSQALKVYLNKKGIESSIYYGCDGFFMPCHQKMGDAMLEYVVRNVKGFFFP